MSRRFQTDFNKISLRFAFLGSLLVLAGCNNENQLFRKLDLKKAGIGFENELTSNEDLNIIDYIYFYNGSGVATGDINGDGLADIFFSGNQVKNKLYLNKGNLEFEDITDRAGVGGNNTWKTGSIMGDVNGDGLLDIYSCAVVGLKNLTGHNELFINNGDNTFTESAAAYGLDFESYSSTAAFLDYDKDGDLDMFLLNQAVHTSGSFGHADLRHKRTYETGGKLLRNDKGKFTDVSDQAGIYGGINGYGLGIAVSDLNLDGFPDIYIGNDFHEDDYIYINNGNGSFTEQGKLSLTSTSKFTMGVDASDINHDGFPDLISLDMLPEEEEILKRSVDEENISILRLRTEKYGYNYQFPRNVLQINMGNGKFAETALLSGVAATDWSWSPHFADFDQDGHQDLFISNGIPFRPNDLDYFKYVSSEQIANMMSNTKVVDQKALSLMPEGKAQNYIFKGSGSYLFENKSLQWLPEEKTCSTSTSVADLDNDGDLDIITNNVNDKPTIYINQINGQANYLKVRLKFDAPNTFGIGSKVYSYHSGLMQMKELFASRGFQASSEAIIHLGYGNHSIVDSLKVVWPNGKVTKLSKVATNQLLVVSTDSGESSSIAKNGNIKTMFNEIDPKTLGIDFKHKEDTYTDFDRIKLLPYQQSDRGPATAIGDINNDDNIDIYFGGSKHISGQFFIQSNQKFIKKDIPFLLKDSIKEDVDAVIDDFNNDGKADLYIGTGGADFSGQSKPLLDSYYSSNGGDFKMTEITDYYENASCVKLMDFDADGDRDLFVGNESVSNDFGQLPKSYLLLNDKGEFKPVQKDLFENLGMITDAIWDDYNRDGTIDLIVIGEWMQPTFLKNNRGVFEKDYVLEGSLEGLWQSIAAFDIDKDGDTDYLLGNWGLNSKYHASQTHPMKMYYSDFDGNGSRETVVAIEKKGNYYTLDGLDLLASQMPVLRKKFTSYKEFSGKRIEDVFSNDQLKKSKVYSVQELRSGYLRNDKGKFSFVEFPNHLQVAPIMAQYRFDFDGDGTEEVLMGGNYFGIQPFHGRLGSFPGALIKNAREFIAGDLLGLNLWNKSVRQLNVIRINNDSYLLVTINNSYAQVYKLPAR
jgi:enediyne biosynthesis protein E4